MNRITRYQGAIYQDHSILLITHRIHETGREYWVIPGGGLEDGETEEECVAREMKEETYLDVRVERLLVHEPGHPDGIYKFRKTYLCTPIGGEAQPGFEPERFALGCPKQRPGRLADSAGLKQGNTQSVVGLVIVRIQCEKNVQVFDARVVLPLRLERPNDLDRAVALLAAGQHKPRETRHSRPAFSHGLGNGNSELLTLPKGKVLDGIHDNRRSRPFSMPYRGHLKSRI